MAPARQEMEIKDCPSLLTAECGQQFLLPACGQSGGSIPVQTLVAFPVEQVGEQVDPRPMTQPGGGRGSAGTGEVIGPGNPQWQRVPAGPRGDSVFEQPCRGRGNGRPGVPTDLPARRDPLGERD